MGLLCVCWFLVHFDFAVIYLYSIWIPQLVFPLFASFFYFQVLMIKSVQIFTKIFDRITLMNFSYILVMFQLELWREFAKQRRMEHKHVFCFVQIMIAIPVNTGWIERVYSKLEIICTKRRSKLLVDNIRNELFLSVHSFPQHSWTKCTWDIVAVEVKKFPPYLLEFFFLMILLFIMLRYFLCYQCCNQ